MVQVVEEVGSDRSESNVVETAGVSGVDSTTGVDCNMSDERRKAVLVRRTGEGSVQPKTTSRSVSLQNEYFE